MLSLDGRLVGHPENSQERWCARGESNPHVRNGHQILSLARLPIPPPALSTVFLTAEEVVAPPLLIKKYF